MPPRPPRSPRRRTSAAALRCALAALVLAACDDLGPDQGIVTLRYREQPPLERERLVVTLEDRERQYYVEGIDLAEGADGWLESRPLRFAASGQLRVRVAMRSDGTSPAAALDAMIPLTPGRRWRVDVFASALPGSQACAGCAGLQRVGIVPAWRPSAQDWLYLTWTAAAPPVE